MIIGQQPNEFETKWRGDFISTTFLFESFDFFYILLQIGQLQKLQNAAARIVSLSSKRSHITPILKTLHWLPVKERIIFKILLFVYYIVNGTAPDYNKSLLRLYQTVPIHEPYDPPILVFCKFRFPRNPGGNELLLMPDQPCGIHFHRS